MESSVMNAKPATRFDRRRLLNWFLGTSFGALVLSVLYPIFRYVTPPRIAEASTNEVEGGLAEDPVLIEKGFKIIRFGADWHPLPHPTA